MPLLRNLILYWFPVFYTLTFFPLLSLLKHFNFYLHSLCFKSYYVLVWLFFFSFFSFCFGHWVEKSFSNQGKFFEKLFTSEITDLFFLRTLFKIDIVDLLNWYSHEKYVYMCLWVSLCSGPTSSEMSLVLSSNRYAYLVLWKDKSWCFILKELFQPLQ